jgi:hypothetical protein
MMKRSTGAVLITLALLAGCKSTPETQPSGFLGDYSQLAPAPDREGVMLYVDRSANVRPYTKLLVDPVQVLVTPAPDQAPPPPEVLQRIGAQFQDSLRRALTPAYQMVDQPGPDVLRVRSAITGLRPAKPPTGVTDFIPIKAIYNVGVEATGTAPRVAEMTGEMEVLDPGGKRIAAATATRKGDKKLPQGDQVTWESLPPITDYWAKNFRMRLDELRGVTPPPAAGEAH